MIHDHDIMLLDTPQMKVENRLYHCPKCEHLTVVTIESIRNFHRFICNDCHYEWIKIDE